MPKSRNKITEALKQQILWEKKVNPHMCQPLSLKNDILVVKKNPKLYSSELLRMKTRLKNSYQRIRCGVSRCDPRREEEH
jgi:hypothetical protein